MPSLSPCRVVVAALLLAATANTQSFVPHESGPVAPLRLSPDGSRLFVADTQGARLCVFDLGDPSSPFLVAEIPVGLDPVSVMPRTRDEVWVTNQWSDSVSIVSVLARRVVATLRVGDEPSDVVFANGKAFVSCATRDLVQVFDATTRLPLGSVPILGKDPRALAVSPDGQHVYAVVQRSGNGTTLLPDTMSPPPPPGAPHTALIVRADDPAWFFAIPYTLPDHDVADIDANTLAVARYFDAVGTTNTAIAVHPVSGELWVANTDARNLVAHEPNLRGHAIHSRVTRITTGPLPTVAPFDLNPGFTYSSPNANELALALAEPFGVAIDATSGRVFVAAHGTDRVGVLDLNGNVLARIEVGNTPGATVDTRNKRGPRAVALHPSSPRLYVLQHLRDTLSVVDTSSLTVLRELPIASHDPMPALLREGRNFLYDAKLSGNGTMSCASCHIDADLDGLAWDLGDPNGVPQNPVFQPQNPFFPFLVPFHPLKGPLTTQTLRGLPGTGPLHWRGDRADFAAFAPAFDSLLGGVTLPPADMADLAAFVLTIVMPSNPNQMLDRSLRTAPANNNEAVGFAAYHQNIAPPGGGTITCAACHELPLGTNGFVINATTIQEPQQMKVPQLRNLYRKLGLERAPGPQKAGFGLRKDGAAGTLAEFLAIPQFIPWPAATKDDIETFLLALDTGTAPTVGFQVYLDQANAASIGVQVDLALLLARAAAGDNEAVAHGFVDGAFTGLRYEPLLSAFLADHTGVGPFPVATLLAKAAAGAAALSFTGAAPGEGERLGRDRDLDGTLDGEELPFAYGAGTAGCAGEPLLAANSEPRLGNSLYGFVAENGPPVMPGLIAIATGTASLPAFGVTVLVDPLTAVLGGITSDGHGECRVPLPIPAVPSLVGSTFAAQVFWFDACGSQWLSSSAGVSMQIRP